MRPRTKLLPAWRVKAKVDGLPGVHVALVQRYRGRDRLYVRFAGSDRRSIEILADENGFLDVVDVARELTVGARDSFAGATFLERVFPPKVKPEGVAHAV